MNATFEDQYSKAIFDAVDAVVAAPVYAYGNVPDNAAGLYVEIGYSTHIPADNDTSTGMESTTALHIWDTTDSRDTIPFDELRGAVRAALHRQTMTLSGFAVVGIDCEYNDSMIDADGLTLHAVQRYRVHTEEM